MIKKRNYKLIITVAIIVLMIAGIIYFIVSGLNQEAKLKKEMDSVNELISEENIDNVIIRKRLSKTVTRGKYAKVEKTLKKYLLENYNNITEINEIINDSKITASLIIENYKSDGPEFNQTISYLQEKKEKLEEHKVQYENSLTEEKAMTYIENKNLDEYYIELYQNEVTEYVDIQSRNIVLEDSINDKITILEETEGVLDFLKEHKEEWKIENDEIVFESDDLAEQYNNLIENI